MLFIHSTIFWIHIGFGMAALVLFWVPIFTPKGQLNHKRYGHAFKLSMYTVALAGILMSIMVLIMPIALKAPGIDVADEAAAKVSIRLFYGFLGLLGLLTFVTTRHGIHVLLHKNNRDGMRRAFYIMPNIGLFCCGILYVFLGIEYSQVIFAIFGGFSMLLAVGTLKYIFKANIAANSWILEHIGSILGSGIAAYTAFLTFGGRRLLDLGDYQVIVWIAPAIIGMVSSYIVTKKYKRLFNIQPQSKTQSETQSKQPKASMGLGD